MRKNKNTGFLLDKTHFIYLLFITFILNILQVNAQHDSAVWRVNFDNEPCAGTGRFTYLCRDTGECLIGDHEEWCVISPSRAQSEGVELSPDGGYMYAGYITSAKSQSHRAYPCVDYNGIFSDPAGIENPIVNQWWVWFDDEGETWSMGYWHHFLTLADINWNVITMSAFAPYDGAEKEVSIAHTGTVWNAPRAERIMPQKEWVLFSVYIDPFFTHNTGEAGLMVCWMNGKKIIVGGGEFVPGRNNLADMGDLLVKAHWGVYGSGGLTKGRQYNDDYGVWKAAAFDTLPPSPPDDLTVSNVTQTSCELSWTPSTDTMIISYEIYQDDTLVFTTATDLSATINGLSCDSTYNFKVKAIDVGNNVSAPRTALVTTESCGGTPSYILTVNNGAGDGAYPEDDTVYITANPAPYAHVFDHWEGDTVYVDDAGSDSTMVIMPASDITITAAYKALPKYNLTVENGSGDGDYIEDEVVNISPDIPYAYVFDHWTGDVAGVADTNNASTTITMPASDITVTAVLIALPTFNLTVENGNGDGDYLEDDTIDIEADPAPAGEVFDIWTGDTTYLYSAADSITKLIMPAADITITATYRPLTTFEELSATIEKVYPNPVSDILHIESKTGISRILVTDISGVTVKDEHADPNRNIHLDVTDLVSGYYILKIITADGEQIIRRFVKE